MSRGSSEFPGINEIALRMAAELSEPGVYLVGNAKIAEIMTQVRAAAIAETRGKGNGVKLLFGESAPKLKPLTLPERFLWGRFWHATYRREPERHRDRLQKFPAVDGLFDDQGVFTQLGVQKETTFDPDSNLFSLLPIFDASEHKEGVVASLSLPIYIQNGEGKYALEQFRKGDGTDTTYSPKRAFFVDFKLNAARDEKNLVNDIDIFSMGERQYFLLGRVGLTRPIDSIVKHKPVDPYKKVDVLDQLMRLSFWQIDQLMQNAHPRK